MQEAGIFHVMRTILIIILVYYGLKFIGRIVFPMFFKRMMKNVEKKFNQQQYKNPTTEQQVKEGETVIDKTPDQRSKSNNDVGDYVDYEDVE